MTPFLSNKSFFLRLSLDLSQPTSNQEAQDLVQHMNDIIKQPKAKLLMLQEAQKSAANLHRVLALSYLVKKQVWPNLQNICTQNPSKKLDNKLIGPFNVLELISKRVCWLKLPKTLLIHPVFHVFLLYLAAQDLISGQNNQHSGLVIGTNMDDPDVCEVKSIIDSQASRGRQKFKYLVK